MPLEISEISVHIVVGESLHASAAATPAPAPTTALPEAMTPERVDALVRACVRDVLGTIALQQAR